MGIETVAVYSDADSEAMHRAMADQAHHIGGAPARESYLCAERIVQAALAAKADAVHPGYGFLSENREFADLVTDSGLTWIGPTGASIEEMGDKGRARELARAAGVPVLPGSARFHAGNLQGIAEAAAIVGYPLLVKAAAGGGGIGMRLVQEPDNLEQTCLSTQAMAEKAFGDGTIYLERFVRRARHVEVQVFGFGDGEAIHLFERDCSIQRRFQKVIEETCAPNLPDPVRAAMAAAAVRLVKAVRYAGVGTVEFVVDADSFEFFFLEMNTRIQVEHPITEMVTGLDLVSMQLDFARGKMLPRGQDGVEHRGHALECRIYAENPQKNFLPSPGRLEVFHLPEESESLRIDSGFRTGDSVSVYYDPLIAKMICHGDDRAAAIATMDAALAKTEISGVRTNVDFLRRVLVHSAFQAGDVSTDFIDQHRTDLLG
jgi:acetyl/propionyl-CoA carboxylase alpha subunit